uniref:GPI-anchored protein LLG1-like domain-containing protein n=1 Tax=Oryza glaberrima TaxID=4538 RepID=I1P135_ORYGL
MGSSIGATIFYCVALSMVIVMTQLPPTEADSVPAAEFASSDLKAVKLTSRKLMGAANAPAPLAHRDVPSAVFDEMKGPFTELGKKCKAASVTECCDAFKEVACPHNTLLNDLDNGCGDDMFYFIHTYGRLPPGTIFKKCVEGPYGMKC